MIEAPELTKRFAEWHLGNTVDWRPHAIFWRHLWRTPWYGWPIAMLHVAASALAMAAATVDLGSPFRILMRKRANHALALIAQEDSPFPQFPAETVFYYGSTLYGEDSGVFTFCEGWLLFEGQSTTFSVKRDDVFLKQSFSELWNGPDLRFPLWLYFTVEGRKFQVGIYAFPKTATDRQDGLDFEFECKLRGWARTPRHAEGESVYPPITPHPVGRYGVQCYAAAAMLFGFVALAAMECVGKSVWIGLVAVMGLALCMFAAIGKGRKLAELEAGTQGQIALPESLNE